MEGTLTNKEFPPFRLDTVNQCLWRRVDRGNERENEERILLTPKAFAVLRYLVEHAGQLVTQDELLDTVWPGTNVEPAALNNQILNIRNALGDHPKNPVFIETLTRRGYRFIAPVSECFSGANPGSASRPTRPAGRQAALDTLRDSLEKALRVQHQVVFVTGEPGIGKTTLIDEFQRRAVADVAGISTVRGQCVEGYGGKEAYYPMLEAVGQLCRGGRGASVVQTLASQAPTWLAQFPALITREHREMLHREILGATRERMLREIGDALEAITSASPLLLVFEDLQWVDASTVDLISALARRRGPLRLMMLGTYSPAGVEFSNHPLKTLTQDLLVHRLCHEIPLEPLSEAEITDYLAGEVSETAPPNALAALLYARAGGNPLFMVAALEHLEERGVVSREQGCWQLRLAPEEIDLGAPESLRKMIETHIERLTTEEQRLLEAASVRGVSFMTSVIAPVADLDEDKFEELCEDLSRRHQMVRWAGTYQFPDGTLSQRYEFAHSLYREVFYRRQVPGRRAKLHRLIGERLEQLFSGHRDEVAGELAEHFEKGFDWVRAVKHLRLAAETSGRRYAHREAAAILEHALELASKTPEAGRTVIEIGILEKLATIYAVLLDTRAIETYEALAARASHAGQVDVEVRALIDMAWPLSWTSSQRTLEVLERALQLSDLQGDPRLRAQTRARCFVLRLWEAWNPRDVEEFCNAYAEILHSGNHGTLAPYLGDRGYIKWICSEYREAHRSFFDSRTHLFETVVENPYLNVSYLKSQVTLPVTLLFLGEWGEALREITEVLSMLDKNGDYYWGQRIRLSQAWVHLQAMDFPGVLAICNSALPLVRDPEPRSAPGYPIPTPPRLRMCLILTASAETAMGNYESALHHLLATRSDMERAPAVSHWYNRMQLEYAFTELWLAKGDLTQARPQAESFLKFASATAERTFHALAWEANARVAMAELDLKRAQSHISRGLSTMEGFELPLAAWRVHSTACQIYRNSGDLSLAERHRALSRDAIMKLANSLPAEAPLRQTFLSAPMVHKILNNDDNPYLRPQRHSAGSGIQ
jgi:DNA-binding winged helix-turn-helix (wHTH) protein/tetratricopeptide (TPR) repeat protein